MNDSDPDPSNGQGVVAPAAQQRFFKLGEVQRMFGVSRMTVYRWVHEQGLKVVRIENTTRIRQSELERFIARHEQSESTPNQDLVQGL